ncbi:MAG: hypothetical protein HY286_14260 [Planctomycetes bacterium]|nr:hypothetical protein [Planctomycetota bacterium]
MSKANKTLFLAALATISIGARLHAQGGLPAYAPPVFFPTPAPVMPAPPAGITPPTIFVAGDVNNDGATDLVHLNTLLAPDVVFAQLRIGAGYVVAPVTVLAGYPPVTQIALGDLNMDGTLDLAVLSPAVAGVFTDGGVGTGFFAAGPFTPVPVGGGTLLAMSISEVTGDGIPDLLFLIDGPGGAGGIDSVQVEAGFGGFAFGGAGATPIGVGATAFEPVDIDSNGAQDLVTLRTVPTNGFYIHAQVAPATFVPGPMPFLLIPGGPSTTTFAAADLDIDGDPDLATLRPAAAAIFTFLQGAPGFFGAPIVSPTPAGLADNFKIADMNGDCILDATYLAAAGGLVWDQAGTGLGGFAPGPLAFPLGTVSFWQVTADLDSDGTIDIAALNSGAGGDGSVILTNIQPDPMNVSPYGMGTAGRLGIQGMLTNGPPVNGTPGFGFTTTNAPPRSLGLLLITDSPDFAGSDPFGIGAILHVDFAMATTVFAFNMYSGGEEGTAYSITGIPLNPALVGSTFYAQSVWVWTPANAWFNPPFGVSTSRAIKLTIL